MRIGLFTSQSDLDRFVGDVRVAKEAGLVSVWSSQVFGIDALTALAVAGREVPDIELGTSVVPIQPRHPMVLAGQALTTQAACGGRLTLGIGLSHQPVVENMWGLPFDRPATEMREYLEVLMPLLHEKSVGFEGDTVKAMGNLTLADVPPPSVVVAALGPVMLANAGRLADGTVTWMVGAKTLADHIVPKITKAAADAGRPEPRVVVALPTAVTDDTDAARQRAAELFAVYGDLPSYRAMLDREGADGPADVAVVGDEDAVRSQIEGFVERGATEFVAAPFAERERTIALLKTLT